MSCDYIVYHSTLTLLSLLIMKLDLCRLIWHLECVSYLRLKPLLPVQQQQHVTLALVFEIASQFICCGLLPPLFLGACSCHCEQTFLLTKIQVEKGRRKCGKKPFLGENAEWSVNIWCSAMIFILLWFWDRSFGRCSCNFIVIVGMQMQLAL